VAECFIIATFFSDFLGVFFFSSMQVGRSNCVYRRVEHSQKVRACAGFHWVGYDCTIL